MNFETSLSLDSLPFKIPFTSFNPASTKSMSWIFDYISLVNEHNGVINVSQIFSPMIHNATNNSNFDDLSHPFDGRTLESSKEYPIVQLLMMFVFQTCLQIIKQMHSLFWCRSIRIHKKKNSPPLKWSFIKFNFALLGLYQCKM